MKMRLLVGAVIVMVCVNFPARGAVPVPENGDQKPSLKNGDSVGLRNVFSCSDDQGNIELFFELCAGDPDLLSGLAVNACVPGEEPISCNLNSTQPVRREPFGACIEGTCLYALNPSEVGLGRQPDHVLVRPLDVEIRIGPVEADSTYVMDFEEYLWVLDSSIRPKAMYLISRDTDRSGTILTVKQTVRFDGPQVPDPTPEFLCEEGCFQGDPLRILQILRPGSPTKPK